MNDLSNFSLSMMKFHPLPHEFGLRINVVPASFSAGWVAGWEIGNAVRMKSEALRRGEMPVTSFVGVKFAFVDGKMVAVGGEARVSVVGKPKVLQKTDEPLNIRNIQDVLNKRNQENQDKKIQDLLGIKIKTPHSESPQNPWRSQQESESLSELKFFQALMQIVDQEIRDELIRNYLLYASGLISEKEFSRRLENLKNRQLVGNVISEIV
ncbi:MAG: hypothetical protein NZ927_07400 [Candidatus Calescibacterium sp.]|nr:hypothetical protein [Candidatus Calescibacterium sp.]MDW8087322.1 hypothetical protein [Candidatus Calescibacterium sp.]